MDAEPINAAEKPAGYPADFMERMSRGPMAAASATADPEMPDMMTEAKMPTCASPPRR